MNNTQLSKLIERFLNAQTTEAEEQTLAEYFQSAESVPEEWQPVKELFFSFQTDAYELTDSELAALTAEPAAPKRKVVPLYWFAAAAACAAILFVIGSTVLWNDAKHEKIAKTEAINAPAVTDSSSSKIEEMAAEPMENLAKANTQIEQSPSKTEEKKSPSKLEGVPRRGEGVCPEVTYEENIEPAPNLLAENTEPDPTAPKAKMVAYSEVDLPITNVENLIYTDEDIQKLQEISRQRLIAEIQNDVEVSRHNLSQLKQFLANN